MTLTIRNVTLRQDYDRTGALILIDGELSAIFSQLSGIHGDRKGRWFCEFCFGLQGKPGPDFPSIEAAADWVIQTACA